MFELHLHEWLKFEVPRHKMGLQNLFEHICTASLTHTVYDQCTVLSGVEKSLAEVAAAGDRTSEARIINILSFFGSAESFFQDMSTVNGPGWGCAMHLGRRRVHLTSNGSWRKWKRVTALTSRQTNAHGWNPRYLPSRCRSRSPSHQRTGRHGQNTVMDLRPAPPRG
jgi:hypothetical protein